MVTVIGFSLLATFSVIKFGLKPKAVPIIKASNFEDPVKLGNYIHRQLYQKLLTSSPLVFGYNKENLYEKKVIETVIELVSKNQKEKSSQIVQFSADETYSGSSSNRQSEIKSHYGENLLAFSVINLKGVEEAKEIINCESDHTYSVWLDCMKKQKVRQINRAKKVDVTKPVGIVELQSQRDILIYIRE